MAAANPLQCNVPASCVCRQAAPPSYLQLQTDMSQRSTPKAVLQLAAAEGAAEVFTWELPCMQTRGHTRAGEQTAAGQDKENTPSQPPWLIRCRTQHQVLDPSSGPTTCHFHARNIWQLAKDTAVMAVLHCRGAGDAEASGFQAAAAEMGTRQLRQALEFPPETGPSDWGPIPYLPDPDVLVQNMESQWGDLDAYRGLNSTAAGGGACWV